MPVWSIKSCLSVVAFIGGALFVLQQFAGINGVLYFSSLTFQDVGITSGALASLYIGLTNFAGLGTIWMSISHATMLRNMMVRNSCSFSWVCSFPGTLCALYLMDKQGRKRLLVGSYFGMVSESAMLLILSFFLFLISCKKLSWVTHSQ